MSDAEIRKVVGEVLRSYLTGELDDMIAMEEIKSQEGSPLSAMSYSVGGMGSAGPKESPIVQAKSKRQKAQYRKKQLVTLDKMVRKAMDIIGNTDSWRRIIILYYQEGHTISQIAKEMKYSKRSVEEKKKRALDKVATLLNFKEYDILRD